MPLSGYGGVVSCSLLLRPDRPIVAETSLTALSRNAEPLLGFLRHHLKDRVLAGVQLIVSDACIGLVEAVTGLLPDVQWQRCVVHFHRNVFSQVPKGKVADVARMLKAIHAHEDRRSAQDKLREVVAKLKTMRLPKAAELVEAKAHETLTCFAFPTNHWRQIKTNNSLERIIREIRRRKRVVGAFPDGRATRSCEPSKRSLLAGQSRRKAPRPRTCI